jgi:hypothetical protein
LLADYLTDARTALDTARTAGEQVALSPAWCRQVTGCSTGTSVKVAAALRTEHDQDEQELHVRDAAGPVPTVEREAA